MQILEGFCRGDLSSRDLSDQANVRQGQRERAVKYGAALTPYQGAHLCVLVCLPHKMAPGSGNGP